MHKYLTKCILQIPCNAVPRFKIKNPCTLQPFQTTFLRSSPPCTTTQQKRNICITKEIHQYQLKKKPRPCTPRHQDPACIQCGLRDSNGYPVRDTVRPGQSLERGKIPVPVTGLYPPRLIWEKCPGKNIPVRPVGYLTVLGPTMAPRPPGRAHGGEVRVCTPKKNTTASVHRWGVHGSKKDKRVCWSKIPGGPIISGRQLLEKQKRKTIQRSCHPRR